jgi:hypothetical protein
MVRPLVNVTKSLIIIGAKGLSSMESSRTRNSKCVFSKWVHSSTPEIRTSVYFLWGKNRD